MDNQNQPQPSSAPVSSDESTCQENLLHDFMGSRECPEGSSENTSASVDIMGSEKSRSRSKTRSKSRSSSPKIEGEYLLADAMGAEADKDQSIIGWMGGPSTGQPSSTITNGNASKMEVESMGLKPSQGKVAMDEEEDVGREMLVIAELDAILDSYSSPSVPMQPSTSGRKQAESKLGGSQDFRWNKKSQGFDIDGPSTSTGIVSGGRTTRKRPAPNMPDCEVPNKKIRGPDKKNPQYDSSDDSDDW